MITLSSTNTDFFYPCQLSLPYLPLRQEAILTKVAVHSGCYGNGRLRHFLFILFYILVCVYPAGLDFH